MISIHTYLMSKTNLERSDGVLLIYSLTTCMREAAIAGGTYDLQSSVEIYKTSAFRVLCVPSHSNEHSIIQNRLKALTEHCWFYLLTSYLC
jgi:hypothetical protein